MAETRMTLAEIKAAGTRRNRALLDATDEAAIRAQMVEDGQDPDEAPPVITAPRAATIRLRLGLTQADFAKTIGVPLATLRNWEQGRTAPDPAARALLRVLEREPEAALRALAG